MTKEHSSFSFWQWPKLNFWPFLLLMLHVYICYYQICWHDKYDGRFSIANDVVFLHIMDDYVCQGQEVLGKSIWKILDFSLLLGRWEPWLWLESATSLTTSSSINSLTILDQPTALDVITPNFYICMTIFKIADNRL